MENKLEKFTKNKKQKKVIAFSLVGLVLLVGAITLYRTFALYEEKLEFNVLQGKVPEYTTGDVKIAALIDGEKSSTIPSKNDGYAFESVSCDNGATGEWDNDKWGLFVSNLSKSKTTCTLTFVTKTGTPMLEYITSLVDTSEELAYDNTVDNNLRYIGPNPNNYVKFNNELWRIIGVMNNITDSEGNVGSHIKIIRNESIGDYLWSGSYSKTDNWPDSSLNTLTLNRTFYNDFTDESKSMVSNVEWNLGGSSTPSMNASTFYTIERGTTVYNSNYYATVWTGKIGLMYPSDYGFAVGGDVRNTCLESKLYSYSSNSCYTNDWLRLSRSQWTLTPHSSSSDGAYYVSSGGFVSSSGVYNSSYPIRPVLYLNSNIEIIADELHNGSQEFPYDLKIGS